jgi:hypothetical protein
MGTHDRQLSRVAWLRWGPVHGNRRHRLLHRLLDVPPLARKSYSFRDLLLHYVLQYKYGRQRKQPRRSSRGQNSS